MTKRDIATLACKLLAILALLDFVGTLQSLVNNVQLVYWGRSESLVNGTWTYVPPPNTRVAIVVIESLVPSAIFLIIAVILWFRAESVAARMTRPQRLLSTSVYLNAQQIISIAFAVLGVYVLSSAVPWSLSYLIWLLVQFIDPARGTYAIDVWLGRLVETVAQLVIGFGLLLRSRMLAHFFIRTLHPA